MTSLFARFRFTLALLAAVSPIFSLAGPVPDNKPVAYPDWWFERDVIPRLNPQNDTPTWPTDYPAADDYAALNQGQIKHIATQAYLAMQERGLVSESSPITTMVTAWEPAVPPTSTTDDYAAINIGQLKGVVAPFYLRLRELNYTGQPFLPGQPPTAQLPYPWSNSVNPPDDYALANIGQVKSLFSFSLTGFGAPTDTDSDGLPDAWESQYGLNPNDPDDALLDSDQDGFNNVQEHVMGTNPAVANTLPDSDGDGMPDSYETSNELDPLVDDSLEDRDGDRVPNLFEFKRGTLANNRDSKPQMTFVVNPAMGNSSSTDNVYATIGEAVYAAEEEFFYNDETGQYDYIQAYAVIEVKSAVYAEQVSLSGVPILLLGMNDAVLGPPVIQGGPYPDSDALQVSSASVVDGFTITHLSGRKGRGVYVSSGYGYYSETSNRRRLVNCVVRGNEDASGYGGGIYNESEKLDLVHCTLIGNKAAVNGRAIYNGYGTLKLINSIVWGNTGAALEEIYAYSGSSLSVVNSIIAGGEQGGINEDPQLTSVGWLKSTSPAINRAGVTVASSSLVDIHGEIRPEGISPDLGADEYKDNDGTDDGDGLPDWMEGVYDGDGLSALDEYWIYGTDPRMDDTDGDELTDGAEVIGGTNPLRSDSDNDGIPDGWEVANGLIPTVDDSLEDQDGDRIPNIFEFKRGTLPNDMDSKPQTTFVVDPATGDASATDSVYTTIKGAVAAAQQYTYNSQTGRYDYLQAYAVIEVKSAVYAEQVNLSGVPILLLARHDAVKGPPVIQGRSDADADALVISSASVADGFIITHFSGRKGRGVYISPNNYGYEASDRRRLVNCIIRGNEDRYGYGGGIYNEGAKLDVVHCTITGNKSAQYSRGIYHASGTLNLINSIVWGNTGAASQEIFQASGSAVSVVNSIIAGGGPVGINEDPQLTPVGWLKSTSPAINRNGVTLAIASLRDIHGETRPAGSAPDLGADEYKDSDGTSDGDGLPDWAESMPDDVDGLSAFDEYTTYGTSPGVPDTDGDELADGAEVVEGTNPLQPDTENDGMPDGWEVTNGLNPLEDDSLEDQDGDRVPNVFEFKRGTLAYDADSTPQATFVVDPATGGASATDNVYTTIKGAVDAARKYTYNPQTGLSDYLQAYAVIEVKSAVYAEQVNLSVVPILLLATHDAVKGPPVIQGRSDVDSDALIISSASVVDGFIITHASGRKGRGVYVSTSSGAALNRRRLVNCIIRGNEASSGGGVYNSGAGLDMVHCTVTGNKTTSGGRTIYNGTGTLNLINSILWGNNGTATQEIFQYSGGSVSVVNSIIAGGWPVGINEDPQLTPVGWLKSTSPAINRTGVTLAMASLKDIHGESRPVGSEPDLGADEYKDSDGSSDGDGLPDWAEGIPDDMDGLSVFDEYRIYGSNPSMADTDEDGLNDGAEVAAGANPLHPDTDNDGMSDGWETTHGFDLLSSTDAPDDEDDDDLSNLGEYIAGTDPRNADTDDDEMPDNWEVIHGLNPLVDDSLLDKDNDGLSNHLEYQIGTRPDYFDTDGDLLPDGFEYQYESADFNPLTYNDPNEDFDDDGLSNLQEVIFKTDPTSQDSDEDGTLDGDEVTQGSFPSDPSDDGQAPSANEMLTVKIIVGDPSGSHSERWAVIVKDLTTGSIILNHQSLAYGELSSDTDSVFNQFRKRHAYELQLVHIGTNPSNTNPDFYPDYDWALEVSVKDAQGNFVDVMNPAQKQFIVLDPWDNQTQGISDTIKLLVNRDELTFPWEGAPDRTEQYQSQIVPKRVLLIPAELVADANRDGILTPSYAASADSDATTQTKPFCFWSNDDDDDGDEANQTMLGGNSDEPGKLAGFWEFDGRTPDHAHTGVDGRCDLIDFFPVYLDIKQLLAVLPTTTAGITYKLKQADSGLNFVYTDLTRDHALDYLTKEAATYGTSFNKLPHLAETTAITAEGITLSTTFLDKIKNGTDKGVILVEGTKATDKPLRLVVEKAGVEIAEISLNIKISEVEKMYRWVNLRSAAGQSETRPTNTNEPANYPDNRTNGKMFIWLHGYNVNEQQSRAWNAEAFKRLYQSGSRAMFTAVTWHGDHSQIPLIGVSPDYWENITNAFQTSAVLPVAVNALPGSSKIIVGHSMGNVVVTSAIKDHGLNVTKYFMLNAAVALEAYDASTLQVGAMRHPDWANYNQRLWSTEWYKLFPQGDGRRGLTWINRFGDVPNAINFYSSGEEVLNNNDAASGGTPGQIPPVGGERAWILQEMVKGTQHIGAVLTFDSQGGWGFNGHWDIETQIGNVTRRDHLEPASAAALTDDELKPQPFFRRFQDSSLTGTGGSAAASEYLNRAQILGGAIPALSFPTGRNPVPLFDQQDRNADLMDLKDGWPRASGRWFHSDAKNVAYRYNHKLWEKWVNDGGLK